MALPSWAKATGDEGKFSSRGNAISGGIIYNVIATVFQIIGSLVSVLIFARLLSAEDFGVFGMISPFVGILVMFADGGTVYYTLRRPSIDDVSLSFNFWYCSLIGGALVLVMMLASPLIAVVMDEPRLWSVGLVMSGVLFFSAIGCQHLALAMRCFRNDIRAWTIAASTVGGLSLGVAIALLGGGYWALVGAAVGRIFLQAVLIFLFTGWVPLRLHWDRAELSEILRLSNAELISRVTLNAVREVDRIVVGILFVTTTVGYYSLAYLLSITPLVQLMTPLFFVIVPYLSELRNEREKFLDGFRLMVLAFIYVMLPGAIYAGIYADEILGFVVGQDKIQAAEVFPILILTAVMNVMIVSVSLAFQSVDRPDLTRRYNFWTVPLIVLTMAVAIPVGTPEAIAWGTFAANLIAVILRFGLVMRFFEQGIAEEFLRLLPILVASLAAALFSAWIASILFPMTDAWPEAVRVLGLILLFGGIWGLGGVLLFRAELARAFVKPMQQEPAE